jgi:hypothetical protein
VVICDGSGRAADLLAFAHKYTLEDGWVVAQNLASLVVVIAIQFVWYCFCFFGGVDLLDFAYKYLQ